MLSEQEWISAVQQQWQGATVITHGVRRMVDMTNAERAAIERAIPVVGQYIESLGTTDLAAMSYEQFSTLVEVAVTAYQDAMLRMPMK